MNFDKSLLPPPRTFYEREFGQLPRPDRHGWARTCCPFHDSKSRKSLSVNFEHGGYYCFSCGAKGGDLVSFVMARDRVTFPRACERLGAWKALSSADEKRIEHEKQDRERVRVMADQQAEQQKRQRIAARDLLHSLERMQRERSTELSRIAREDHPGDLIEMDRIWADLVLLEDRIREADSAYRQLAGIEVEL